MSTCSRQYTPRSLGLSEQTSLQVYSEAWIPPHLCGPACLLVINGAYRSAFFETTLDLNILRLRWLKRLAASSSTTTHRTLACGLLIRSWSRGSKWRSANGLTSAAICAAVCSPVVCLGSSYDQLHPPHPNQFSRVSSPKTPNTIIIFERSCSARMNPHSLSYSNYLYDNGPLAPFPRKKADSKHGSYTVCLFTGSSESVSAFPLSVFAHISGDW